MICSRCLLRRNALTSRSQTPIIFSSLIIHIQSKASHPLWRFTTSSLLLDDRKPIPADVAEHSTPQRSPPAATSTSAAQPFSTHYVPSPSQVGTPTTPSDPKPSKPGKTPAHPAVTSSVSAGTVLKGLNYFKNKPDPVALEDSEYPPWLWTLLSEHKKDYIGAGKAEMDPRLFSRSPNARRMARKRQTAEALLEPDALKKKTPIFEQSIDLPAGLDEKISKQAVVARQELRKAMRWNQRKDVKEANFLVGMRW